MAITATAIGFAFDAGSGDRELTSVFAICYSLGCIAAVLVVQQAGLFTAVIQPPLILFVAVPGSYFLFHGGELQGVKDLAINCGYPLIERFPLMLFLSATVLLIGLGRWYVGLTSRKDTEVDDTSGTAKGAKPAATTAAAGIVGSVTAKLSGLVLRKPAVASTRRDRTAAQDAAADAPPRRRPSERPPRRRPAGEPGTGAAAAAGAGAGRARGERRPTKRTAPPRPRPSRAAAGDLGSELDAGIPERPRRPRPPRAPEPGAGEPRRRVRTQPREPRRQPPPERRDAGTFDTPRERPQRPRRRFDDYQPFEDPFDQPAAGSGRSTHHPVSRVRYRGSDDEDHRVEHRTRPRSPKGAAVRGRHSMDYDD